jgi:hypothetical protein
MYEKHVHSVNHDELFQVHGHLPIGQPYLLWLAADSYMRRCRSIGALQRASLFIRHRSDECEL